MDNMIRKNGRKIILVIIGCLLCTGLLIYALKKKVINSEKDIICTVYPLKLSLRDTLFYKDLTPFAITRRWDMGDGTLSLSDSFVIKLDGHKGDDGNEWNAEYEQE